MRMCFFLSRYHIVDSKSEVTLTVNFKFIYPRELVCFHVVFHLIRRLVDIIVNPGKLGNYEID